MPTIDLKRLQAHRQSAYRLLPRARVKNPAQALEFVNERGFIFFWPIAGVDLPSLWTATAGDRLVAEAHDDPGHVTWGWKDASLDQRIWYYAKVLRRKATFISLPIAPYFYALSENYGSMEEDHLIAYREGRLSLTARQIYDTLLEKGSLNTIDLRKEARLLHAGDAVFNRGMEDLQKDFKVLPVGIAQAGAWRYAYRYDLTSRHFPDLAEQARPISEAEARLKMTELLLHSVGAVRNREIANLFGWSKEIVERTAGGLLRGGKAAQGEHPGKPGTWLMLPELSA